MKSVHKFSGVLGPRAKQSLHSNLEQDYLQILEDLLGKWRSTVAHSWSKKISSRHPREYSSECGLPGIAILAPRLGSIQQGGARETPAPQTLLGSRPWAQSYWVTFFSAETLRNSATEIQERATFPICTALLSHHIQWNVSLPKGC